MQNGNVVQDKKISIKIKGIRDGLLISAGEGEWSAVQAELLRQIEERAAFFKAPE